MPCGSTVLWHSTKAQRAVLEKTHTDSRQHTDSLPQRKLGSWKWKQNTNSELNPNKHYVICNICYVICMLFIIILNSASKALNMKSSEHKKLVFAHISLYYATCMYSLWRRRLPSASHDSVLCTNQASREIAYKENNASSSSGTAEQGLCTEACAALVLSKPEEKRTGCLRMLL